MASKNNARATNLNGTPHLDRFGHILKKIRYLFDCYQQALASRRVALSKSWSKRLAKFVVEFALRSRSFRTGAQPPATSGDCVRGAGINSTQIERTEALLVAPFRSRPTQTSRQPRPPAPKHAPRLEIQRPPQSSPGSPKHPALQS